MDYTNKRLNQKTVVVQKMSEIIITETLKGDATQRVFFEKYISLTLEKEVSREMNIPDEKLAIKAILL